MKKLIRALGNILLVICSLAVALGAMELFMPHLDNFSLEEAVYQVRRPVVQYLYGEFNPDLHYTLQKDLKNIRLHYPGKLDYTFSTNSEGFRGPEWDMSPERRNILLLGDSFGFGWGWHGKKPSARCWRNGCRRLILVIRLSTLPPPAIPSTL